MRIALLAATAVLVLSGCRQPETAQSNNAQASAGAQPAAPTADASLIVARVSGPEAASVMHERHEGMEAVGKANKAIRRALEGSSPDLAVVRSSASRMAELSHKASHWFPAGTGPDVGKTGAKPEIWQNPQDFAAKVGAFQKAAAAFQSTTAGTDVAAIKASFAELGKSCKSCHDKYRSEMHH